MCDTLLNEPRYMNGYSLLPHRHDIEHLAKTNLVFFYWNNDTLYFVNNYADFFKFRADWNADKRQDYFTYALYKSIEQYEREIKRIIEETNFSLYSNGSALVKHDHYNGSDIYVSMNITQLIRISSCNVSYIQHPFLATFYRDEMKDILNVLCNITSGAIKYLAKNNNIVLLQGGHFDTTLGIG